jgi:hypothetical protein
MEQSSMKTGVQLSIGGALLLVGVSGIVLDYRPVATFAYAIVWWGLLLALDALHAVRWGTSPMRRDWRHFLGIVVPASVLYWLVYEYLNIAFPQWRYTGSLNGRIVQAAFGVASFATVIPIMIELYWLFGGRDPAFRRIGASGRGWLVAFGLVSLAAPLLTGRFWINQAAWVGPALLLLPYVGLAAAAAVPAALAAGFGWELVNYWSLTKWQYTIHPEWRRLFEMPLAGYAGFVPFAFSTLAVYRWLQQLRARPPVAAALWIAAAAATYVLVDRPRFLTPAP